MINVIAQYELYLDYFLPREEDWELKAIRIQIENSGVYIDIKPRNLNEPLFANEGDKVLSSMALELKSIDKFQNDPGVEIKPKILDRITVQVHFRIESIELIKKPHDRSKMLILAVKNLNYFLNHCRAESLSPHVRTVGLIYQFEKDNTIVNIPHSEMYFDADSKQPLKVFETPSGFVDSSCIGCGMSSPESGSVSFAQVIRSLENGEPNISRLLLTDSLSYLRAQRLHEAVLLASTAFEVQTERFMAKLTQEQRNGIKEIINNKTVGLCNKFLELIPKQIYQKVFSNEIDRQQVINLYRTRNKVTHEGSLYYIENDQEITPEPRDISRMINVTILSIDWLDKL